MPAFNAVLTAGELTALRGNWSGKQYCALLPNTIVFRALVNQVTFSASFAQVIFDTVSIGAFGDIRQGMTVYIGTGTDLQSAVFVGRVRKVGTSTILYINETSSAITNDMTITVTNDYRIWERLRAINPATKQELMDWDITFTGNPPIIAGLPSAIVLPTTAVSASVALTPSAQTLQASATVSAWLWNVADGTITTGTTTTQDITVSFPSGDTVRWVRLTVTDNGGRASYFTFPVFCGNPDSASWSLQNVDGASMTTTLEDGSNASVRAFADVSTILDKTLCVLFTIDNASQTVIDMVGRFESESVSLRGDANASAISECEFNLSGVASQLATIPITGYGYSYSASPTKWGDVTNPTVPRSACFGIVWQTTLNTVCSLSFPTSLDDHAFSDLSTKENSESALEALNGILSQANAHIEFSGVGVSRFRRNPSLLPSADRSALSTIAQITVADALDITVTRDYSNRVGVLIAGFGGYNTSTRAVQAFSGKAPAEARGEGGETRQENSQILRANLTITNALLEVRQRTADFYADANRAVTYSSGLFDAWYILTPSWGYWFTLAVASGDTIRGIVYSSQRFVLNEVSYDHDNATGTRAVTVSFAEETVGGSSQIQVAVTPSVSGVSMPVQPEVSNYPDFPPNANLNLPSGFGDLDLPPLNRGDLGLLQPLPPAFADALPTPAPGCRTITSTFASNTNASSGFSTTLGDPYTLTVKGNSLINIGTWEQVFDFTVDDGGWEAAPATYVSGQYWQGNDIVTVLPQRRRQLGLIRNFTETTITGFTVSTDYVRGSFNDLTVLALRFWVGLDATPEFQISASAVGTSPYSGYTVNNLSIITTQVRLAHITSQQNSNSFSGTNRILSIVLRGIGVNPFTGAGIPENVAIDPFYWYYNLNPDGLAELTPSGYGLYVDNVRIIPTVPFSPNHEYSFAFTGTGNPVLFKWGDGSSPPYPDITPTPLLLTVCGAGAGA